MSATYFKIQPPGSALGNFFFFLLCDLCYVQELCWLPQTSVRFGMDTEGPRAVEGTDMPAKHWPELAVLRGDPQSCSADTILNFQSRSKM